MGKKSSEISANTPKLIVYYTTANLGFLERQIDDGKCGYLDITDESNQTETVKLKYDKKAHPQIIPLKPGKNIITYRKISKAASFAGNTLKAINEGNGVMGTVANEIYDAGWKDIHEISSLEINATEGFELTLLAKGGLNKSLTIKNN